MLLDPAIVLALALAPVRAHVAVEVLFASTFVGTLGALERFQSQVVV